jgi:SecD/SecF fusion protein
MRSFFWKFVICLVPCIAAGWVTADAISRFAQGNSGGFKLGPDLAGGTILVYEIDVRKTKSARDAELKAAGKKKEEKDAKAAAKAAGEETQADITVLAEALKRRIDPNDLKNIIIRPSGGEGRVEIVLPTGGTHRARIAAKKWEKLLEDVAKDFKVKKIEVGRGRVLELAEKIQLAESEQIWEKKLFGEPEGWKRLLDNAFEFWPILYNHADKRKEIEALATDKAAMGNLDGLMQRLVKMLDSVGEPTTDKAIQAWYKQQAWEEMMYRATKKWTDLALTPEELARLQQPGEIKVIRVRPEMAAIPPDSTDQLITYIQAKGNVVAQGSLALLENLTGPNIFGTVPADEAAAFIRENYGPSIQTIKKTIDSYTEESGYGKDLSVEEVQRIKDLVAKVGRLEFRILANSLDDKEAIEDAMRMINNDWQADPKLEKEIKDAQSKGLAPPGPRDAAGDPKKYTITVARNNKSTVTYSWVELGPLERRSLHLDNASRTDSQWNRAWNEASFNRGKALKLPDIGGAGAQTRYLLEGALFYSRKCEDRNLPEEERRKKDIEYFVLARDPEFDVNSGKRTPDIDGSLLSSAFPDRDQVGRPQVGFTFGPTGADLFGTLTRKNVSEGTGPDTGKKNRHLAIILDGLVMSAPTINSEIRDRGSISGSFTQKQVEELVNILRAGRLPATLKPQPVSESTIGATLGEDTILSGVIAVLIAFLAILVFMVIYYRFAGFVACVALLANLLLTIGFMVFVQATFTLPGLAGLVLMLGMAVDANILIYERLREERERGASLALSIRNGYDRALPTIIDTHLTGIFTAVVLYIVGNDQLKGFGVSLTVGLIISLFTSLYMTRVMFDFWMSRGWLHKLSMLRLFAKPDFDFMGIRYAMFTATAVVSILGVALFIGRLPNDLNIDFVGGTAYGGKLVQPVGITTMRDLLSEKNQEKVFGTEKEPRIQVVEEAGSEGRRFVLTYQASGDKRTVSLANPPAKDTAEERAKDIQKRAIQLPDPSVELIFTKFGEDEGAKGDASNQFVVRSSEKEVELVQATLDQVLRQPDGKPLLKKIVVDAGPLVNREARLKFFDENMYMVTPAALTAMRNGGLPEAVFTKLDKLRDQPFNDTQLRKKLAETLDPSELTQYETLVMSESRRPVGGSPAFVKTLLAREIRKQMGISDRDGLPFILEVTGEGQGHEDESYDMVKVAFSELKDSQLPAVKAAIDATVQAFQDRPQPDRLENFDSQLATDTRYRAMAAIIASWGGILVYLWFRFGSWTFGLAAVLCLVHDLFFTLGCIAVAHYLHGTWIGDNVLFLEDFKLDLPAVAALLTLVGYSVSDTIVVFDRIREVRGKNPDLTPKMINDSVNQTLSRTVLASLATWLVVVVLYFAGGPGVHLFAYVMVVGVIVGTYSSIYIASPLLLLFGEGKHEESKAHREVVPAETGIRPGMAQ